MIAFDTEDDSNGSVYMVNFFDGENHYTYTDMHDAIRFIYTVDEKIFFAHNLEYDLINVFKNHLELLELYYLSGRLLFAKLRNKRKYFYDSFNFSFASLREVGKVIGLEKLDAGKDFNNIEYCRRDTEIVYYYMQNIKEFIASEGIQKQMATLAGISQTIYLKQCEYDIKGKNIENELLHAYYGGRCEAFHIGNVVQPIVEIDVNSMYPYVMKKSRYPIGECEHTHRPTSDLYVAKCTVTVKKCNIPILPHRKGGKLLFACGTFTTYATSVEIEEAIKNGQIKNIVYHDVYNFTYTEKIFDDFVEHFYTMRKEAKKRGDSFKSNLYKLILNSTYGRFAMNNDIIVIAKDFKKGEYIDEYKNGLKRYRLSIENNTQKNFAIPIFITAYARIELYRLLQQVQNCNYIPLYCDTDSVYFTYREYEPLQDFICTVNDNFDIGNELGQVSCECYKAGAFFGAKKYLVITYNDFEKLRCKGIQREQQKQFLYTGKATRKRPMRLRTGLRRKEEATLNRWVDEFVEQRTQYDKRIVLNENIIGNTEPIII